MNIINYINMALIGMILVTREEIKNKPFSFEQYISLLYLSAVTILFNDTLIVTKMFACGILAVILILQITPSPPT
jgi:hypothetical protein